MPRSQLLRLCLVLLGVIYSFRSASIPLHFHLPKVNTASFLSKRWAYVQEALRRRRHETQSSAYIGQLVMVLTSVLNMDEIDMSSHVAAAGLHPSPPIAEKVTAEVTHIEVLERSDDSSSSAYFSAKSRRSFRSLFTRSSLFTESTGLRSLEGATWKYDLILTMDSGFGSGSRRIGDYEGAREGREKGGFLPRIKGVGRTGKGPAAVPMAMVEAMGAKSTRGGLSDISEGEGFDEQEVERRAEEAIKDEACKRDLGRLSEPPGTGNFPCRRQITGFLISGGPLEEGLKMVQAGLERVIELYLYINRVYYQPNTEEKITEVGLPQPYSPQTRAQLGLMEEELKCLGSHLRVAELKEDIEFHVQALCEEEKLLTEAIRAGERGTQHIWALKRRLYLKVENTMGYLDGHHKTAFAISHRNCKCLERPTEYWESGILSDGYFEGHRHSLLSILNRRLYGLGKDDVWCSRTRHERSKKLGTVFQTRAEHKCSPRSQHELRIQERIEQLRKVATQTRMGRLALERCNHALRGWAGEGCDVCLFEFWLVQYGYSARDYPADRFERMFKNDLIRWEAFRRSWNDENFEDQTAVVEELEEALSRIAVREGKKPADSEDTSALEPPMSMWIKAMPMSIARHERSN